LGEGVVGSVRVGVEFAELVVIVVRRRRELLLLLLLFPGTC